MKAKRTLVVISLLGALQGAVAADQTTNSVLSASTAITATTTSTNSRPQVQPKLEPTYSALQYKLVESSLAGKGEQTKITRLGTESSQAWTTIATHQPNPTLVHDLSTHEPSFCLCSFGHNPWPWK